VIKTIAMVIGVLLLLGVIVTTVVVEMESNYRHEILSDGTEHRALILFHPSRDARFSDDLSMSLAEGFKAAGFSVHRATLTSDTPPTFEGYSLIAVVSNTYWWTPDLPTLRYLKRARFKGPNAISAIGVIGGGGATERSQRMLDEALRKTGANVIRTRSFWLWRPNDESRLSEPNKQVALQLAKAFGVESANERLRLGPQLNAQISATTSPR
jgi:uncharacterized protein (DUF2461 family)